MIRSGLQEELKALFVKVSEESSQREERLLKQLDAEKARRKLLG